MPLTSLKLTIFCLSCAMVLVFLGTLDQVNIGIYEAQNRYIRSLFLYFTPPGTNLRIPWFPGGLIVGTLLLVNLIAGHIARFKLSQKKIGILILHGGLLLLLVGQLITTFYQVESQMRLDEGQTRNYSESFYHDELAIVDVTAPNADQVISIPAAVLQRGKRIALPVDGLEVLVNEVYPNAALVSPAQLPSPAYPHLGLGPMAVAVPLPKTYKQDERNMPAASVSLFGNGQAIGTYSLAAGFPQPRQVQAGGKTYQLTLRPKRYYKPFSISLIDFSHDRYAGTDIARNFSSKIRLIDPANQVDRELLIFMNNPLRYAGLTFYQAGFDNNDTTSILQVVKNPGWLLPYIACVMLTLGMMIQFGMHLVGFVRKRSAELREPRQPRPIEASGSV
jgi:hypothetical protein